MKQIALFASYFEGEKIPYYIQFYLLELKKHFSDVVLIASNKNLNSNSLDFLKTNQIQLQFEKNEGFDFGLWLKAWQKMDNKQFDKIAFINDSCLLYKPLEQFMTWANQSKADFLGVSNSNAINYHIQSYFILFNKTCFNEIDTYFKQNGIINDISELIKTYEIGLSQHLIQNNLKADSFYKTNYKGEFSPYLFLLEDQLQKGVPLIKKKIIYSSFRSDELFTLKRMAFDLNPTKYIQQIQSLNIDNQIIDFNKVVEENPNPKAPFFFISYYLNMKLFQILKFAFKILKK